jgi:hypothetical protein
MRQRTWSLVIAAALLTAGGVALASSVQGKDYERTATVEETGAHAIEWDSPDPGTLRLALAPHDGADAAEATVSLVADDGDRVGTYTLDDEWPRLDHAMEPDERIDVVVHRLVDADLAALHEEGHPVDWTDRTLDERTVTLAEGDGERVRTQVAVDLDEAPIHAGLALDGSVEDLSVTGEDPDERTALEAEVDRADTDQGQALAPEVNPRALDADSLLVRLDAGTLDGTLDLTLSTLGTDDPHVVRASEDADGDEPEEPEDAEETNETTAGEEEPAEPATTQVELEPGTPVAVALEDADAAATLAGEEGHVAVFAPDETVVDTVELDDREHEEREGEDGEEAEPATADLPVAGEGEHVLVLGDADENATLELPAAALADSRTLETETVNGTAAPNGTLHVRGHANATAAIEGGLIGFGWDSQDVDAERTVRLEDPDGEVAYEERRTTAGGAVAAFCPHEDDAVLGPSGDYTVETSSTGVGDEGIAFELTTYVR